MTDHTNIEGGPAPLVEIDAARIFPARDHAEAYIARLGASSFTGSPVILPISGGVVIGITNADGSIQGYEA